MQVKPEHNRQKRCKERREEEIKAYKKEFGNGHVEKYGSNQTRTTWYTSCLAAETLELNSGG